MRKILVLSLLTLTLLGIGCNKSAQQASEPVTLTIWGVFDDDDNYDTVIEDYRAQHPNVSISFREFRYEEYQDELVRALAEGKGPDIFLVHNDWTRQYQSLMTPLPETVTIGYQEVQGTIKKTVVNVLKTEPTLSMRVFKNDFVDAVENDAILEYKPDPKKEGTDKIYALPLSMDTLALYWNKDLLNAAGIASAPTTWTAFQEAVVKLTKFDSSGSIIQSAVGLGTSGNIERAADILALLMMQNGTEMTDNDGDATFDQLQESLAGVSSLPGVDAVRFFTDFANPTKAVYTWNDKQPNSFDAFVNGTSAMFFGYAYHLPLMRVAAPKLDFAISPVPQIEGGRQVNFGNYWLMAVSKDSKNVSYAWDFIQFVTSDDEENTKYLEASRKPPALRSLIASQLEDEDLSAFAGQVLTAKTWYRGVDVSAAENALTELIDNVLSGTMDPTDAIELAASKVKQTQ